MSNPHNDPSINSGFPNTSRLSYSIASCQSSFYNCIAWAVGKTNAKWWPLKARVPGWYWPSEVPREETLAAFMQMFNNVGGYCEWEQENGNLEEGYEKIAIYADKHGVPTHAARQLEDGRWASKIGHWNKDVIHDTLEVWESNSAVESIYGRVVKFLRRERKESPIPPPCKLDPPPPCKMALSKCPAFTS